MAAVCDTCEPPVMSSSFCYYYPTIGMTKRNLESHYTKMWRKVIICVDVQIFSVNDFEIVVKQIMAYDSDLFLYYCLMAIFMTYNVI